MNTRRDRRYYREQIITSCCVSVFFLSVSVYMYFLCLSVVHVVFQEEAEQQVVALRSEISALEREYIAAQHVVSERIVADYGLVENQEKIFLERGEASLVLGPEVE